MKRLAIFALCVLATFRCPAPTPNPVTVSPKGQELIRQTTAAQMRTVLGVSAAGTGGLTNALYDLTNYPTVTTVSGGDKIALYKRTGNVTDPKGLAFSNLVTAVGSLATSFAALGSNSVSIPTKLFYDVRDFGAVCDRVVVNGVNATAGSATVTSAGLFTSDMLGKVFSLYEAGTNQRNHTAFVSNFTSASSITLSAICPTNATLAAAVVGSDVTRHVQAAIDFVSTNGGGEIYIPPHLGVINGPLLDTGTNISHHNAQLFFPVIAANGNHNVTVRFVGSGAQYSRGLNFGEYKNLSDQGSILWSTLSYGPDVNCGRVLDVRNVSGGSQEFGCADTGFAVGLNYVTVEVESMTWRACRDANLAVLDLRGAGGSWVENVVIDTGRGSTCPQGAETFVNTNSIGLYTTGFFNENRNWVNNVMIRGFYKGFKTFENGFFPTMFIADCVNAVDLANITVPCTFGNLNVQECKNIFKVYNCNASVKVLHGNFYNYAQFTNTVNLLDDASGQMLGEINYVHVGVGSRAYGPLPVVGTQNANLQLRYERASTGSDGQRPMYYTPFAVSNEVHAISLNLFGSQSTLISWGTNIETFASIPQISIYNNASSHHWVGHDYVNNKDFFDYSWSGGGGVFSLGVAGGAIGLHGTASFDAGATFDNSQTAGEDTSAIGIAFKTKTGGLTWQIQKYVDATIGGRLAFIAGGVDKAYLTTNGIFTAARFVGSGTNNFVGDAYGITNFPVAYAFAASDEATALTTGNGKISFRMPYAMRVSAVRASLVTAQASGSIFTVDINEGGTTILSTKLTVDNTETTSTTAAAAAVISDADLSDDAVITVDIDQVGDGTAKGLKITLLGNR